MNKGKEPKEEINDIKEINYYIGDYTKER